jgi:hypothetical protein
MFANAVTQVAKFTRAVLISTRLHSGKVETGCNTYILLNADGWALTAGHSMSALIKFNEDKPKYENHAAALATIQADRTLPEGKKQKKVRALEFDPNWLSNVSYFWGPDVTAGLYHVDGLADLAAVKLENLNLPADQEFPKFGNPQVELPQGTSLCKLGFPFHHFKTDFDQASSRFEIDDPVSFVRYPLDGIVTRYINVPAADNSRTAKLIEMSSPGLRGQSGGPWFDVRGVVWGIQSRTHHLALGFSPELEINSKKFVEHQFLNAGAAAYVSEVARFLSQHNIQFLRA